MTMVGERDDKVWRVGMAMFGERGMTESRGKRGALFLPPLAWRESPIA